MSRDAGCLHLPSENVGSSLPFGSAMSGNAAHRAGMDRADGDTAVGISERLRPRSSISHLLDIHLSFDKPAIYSLITSLKPKTWRKDKHPVSPKGRSSLPGLTGEKKEKQKQKDTVISPNTRLQSSAYCFTLGALPKSLAGLKSRLFHILLQPSHHSRVNLASTATSINCSLLKSSAASCDLPHQTSILPPAFQRSSWYCSL